jgi:hypothetical protein
MKVLFAIFLSSFSLQLCAGVIKTKILVQSQKNIIRTELMQTHDSIIGTKEKIFEQGDLKFYASILPYKNDFPEMPKGTPILIYGEVYKGNKIIGRPQIITLLGKEATFRSDPDQKDFYEIKIIPTEMTN